MIPLSGLIESRKSPTAPIASPSHCTSFDEPSDHGRRARPRRSRARSRARVSIGVRIAGRIAFTSSPSGLRIGSMIAGSSASRIGRNTSPIVSPSSPNASPARACMPAELFAYDVGLPGRALRRVGERVGRGRALREPGMSLRSAPSWPGVRFGDGVGRGREIDAGEPRDVLRDGEQRRRRADIAGRRDERLQRVARLRVGERAILPGRDRVLDLRRCSRRSPTPAALIAASSFACSSRSSRPRRHAERSRRRRSPRRRPRAATLSARPAELAGRTRRRRPSRFVERLRRASTRRR